jgi:hypothetical protein
MLTSDKSKNRSLSSDENKFIITSINGLISDSNGLIFSQLIQIKCNECEKTFNNLNENYEHFRNNHKINFLINNNINNSINNNEINKTNDNIIDNSIINSIVKSNNIRRKKNKLFAKQLNHKNNGFHNNSSEVTIISSI